MAYNKEFWELLKTVCGLIRKEDLSFDIFEIKKFINEKAEELNKINNDIIKKVEELQNLEKDLDIEAKNEIGDTMLTNTVFKHQEPDYCEAIRYLLDLGADVTVFSSYRGLSNSPTDMTVLQIASKRNNPKILKIILQYDKDINKNINLKSNDCYKQTALHYAVGAGSVECAHSLITSGADVKAVNVDGETPLHIAAAKGYLDIAKLLYDKGADVKAVNVDGETPFNVAEAIGKHDIMAFLIDLPECGNFKVDKSSSIKSQKNLSIMLQNTLGNWKSKDINPESFENEKAHQNKKQVLQGMVALQKKKATTEKVSEQITNYNKVTKVKINTEPNIKYLYTEDEVQLTNVNCVHALNKYPNRSILKRELNDTKKREAQEMIKQLNQESENSNLMDIEQNDNSLTPHVESYNDKTDPKLSGLDKIYNFDHNSFEDRGE